MIYGIQDEQKAQFCHFCQSCTFLCPTASSGCQIFFAIMTKVNDTIRYWYALHSEIPLNTLVFNGSIGSIVLVKFEMVKCIIWVNMVDFVFAHAFQHQISPNWAFWQSWAPEMTWYGIDMLCKQKYYRLVEFSEVWECEMHYLGQYGRFCLFPCLSAPN